MNRSELERLDRDTLIARAEESGVARARILTRPELIDELLVRASGAGGRPEEVVRLRGLFGRARDSADESPDSAGSTSPTLQSAFGGGFWSRRCIGGAAPDGHARRDLTPRKGIASAPSRR